MLQTWTDHTMEALPVIPPSHPPGALSTPRCPAVTAKGRVQLSERVSRADEVRSDVLGDAVRVAAQEGVD